MDGFDSTRPTLIAPKLTFFWEHKSVEAAEKVVKDYKDEEISPHQLVDGAFPPGQQLEEQPDGARAREHFAAVGHSHLAVGERSS